jgi:hypothetical protein
MRDRLFEDFSRTGSDSCNCTWYRTPRDKELHKQQTQQKPHATSLRQGQQAVATNQIHAFIFYDSHFQKKPVQPKLCFGKALVEGFGEQRAEPPYASLESAFLVFLRLSCNKTPQDCFPTSLLASSFQTNINYGWHTLQIFFATGYIRCFILCEPTFTHRMETCA